MVFIIFFLFLIIEKGSPRLEVWGEKKRVGENISYTLKDSLRNGFKCLFIQGGLQNTKKIRSDIRFEIQQ